MTDIQYKDILKHDAKKACIENGLKCSMKHMTLLESGSNEFGTSYVMFEDRKTGKQYQCYANWNNYTADHPSKWIVSEYND